MYTYFENYLNTLNQAPTYITRLSFTVFWNIISLII